MKKWTSNAQWPLYVYRGMYGNGITSDEHDSRESAQAICAALRSEGFGGEQKHFPIRTWVEEKQA
jgi:hypothetical protein